MVSVHHHVSLSVSRMSQDSSALLVSVVWATLEKTVKAVKSSDFERDAVLQLFVLVLYPVIVGFFFPLHSVFGRDRQRKLIC